MAIVIGGGSGNAISINSSVGSAGQVIVSDGTNSSWGSVSGDGFVAGTLMLFQQTTAPTGWTKQTTHDNKALRVVSGSASSGGTTAFTSVFTSRTPAGGVDNHTLTIDQIPSHTHTTVGRYMSIDGGTNIFNFGGAGIYPYRNDINATGGSQPHNHGFTGTAMDFAVQYVDLIIASKN